MPLGGFSHTSFFFNNFETFLLLTLRSGHIVLGWYASGMTTEDIIKDHPELNQEDLKATLAYAADREHKIKIAS
jgi:uncharacterized protein YneF (UPF0154 family)